MIINECDKKDCLGEMLAIYTTEVDGYLSFSYSTGKSFKNVEFNQVIKYLKVADDCHSYNVILSSGSSIDTVKLSTTRSIAEGKELSLWFASEILAAIHMPFLTPANIKGEKSYTCHKCNRTYEYPNPLKMHLSLNDCERKVSLENILRRLCTNIKSINNNQYKQSKVNDMILKNAQTIKSEIETSCVTSLKDPLNQSAAVASDDRSKQSPNVGLTSTDTVLLHQPTGFNEKLATQEISQYCSAFKPYKNGACQNITKTNITDSYRTNILSSSSPSLIMLPDTTQTPRFPPSCINAHSLVVLPVTSPKTNDVLRKSFHDELDLLEKRAVDMETFVSNLGKLKHGHLCLYCGKVYSRKYGLKIHIRTHTGFKPLKCKYCLRPFGDPSNLNKHVRLHAEGETPYRCELCNKILVRRRDLERHMKSRHQTNCSITVTENLSSSHV